MAVRVASVILVVGIVLWAIFVFPLAVQIMHYRSYTSRVSPEELRWTTLPIHEELWRPVAHFVYTVRGEKYEGNEVFQGGLYRTPYAADVAIKAINNNNPVVWYSPSNPSQATIEKFFPLKKILYAIITLLLIVYSAWAAFYLTEKFYRKG